MIISKVFTKFHVDSVTGFYLNNINWSRLLIFTCTIVGLHVNDIIRVYPIHNYEAGLRAFWLRNPQIDNSRVVGFKVDDQIINECIWKNWMKNWKAWKIEYHCWTMPFEWLNPHLNASIGIQIQDRNFRNFHMKSYKNS